jgi:hypothetical protein
LENIFNRTYKHNFGDDEGVPSAEKKHTGVDQILVEKTITDILQNIVNYCNSHYLKNFQLCLEIDESGENGGEE